MKKLTQVLLIAILLVACKSMQYEKLPTRPESLLFEMQKGGCYGTCPIYTLSLYKDRLVKYNGKRFTENRGVYEWYLSKKDFQKINAMLIESFNSDLNYNLEVQDLPLTRLNIKNTYEVKFKGSCPKSFQADLKEIELLLLKNASWKFRQ